MNKKKKSEEIEELDEHVVEQSEAAETTDSTEEEVDFQDKYMRLYAEFDNFRKRTMREKADLISSASSDIMTQLLPLVDDFDRAEANATDDVETMNEAFYMLS